MGGELASPVTFFFQYICTTVLFYLFTYAHARGRNVHLGVVVHIHPIQSPSAQLQWS